MVQSLLRYIEELRHPPDPPSFEPEIDDFDAEQDRKLRYVVSRCSKIIRTAITLSNVTQGTFCKVDFAVDCAAEKST